jgi:hypothetical protein
LTATSAWSISHYRRPDLLVTWARTLWRREALGSTGVGHGLGLLHDFQAYNSTVRTDSAIVDWWLVLLPGGVDWRAIDHEPVHYMVGPVMEQRQPGSYLRVMEGISRGLRHRLMADGFDPAAWATRLAGLPGAEAAREVNFVVARGLCGTGRVLITLEPGLFILNGELAFERGLSDCSSVTSAVLDG